MTTLIDYVIKLHGY